MDWSDEGRHTCDFFVRSCFEETGQIGKSTDDRPVDVAAADVDGVVAESGSIKKRAVTLAQLPTQRHLLLDAQSCELAETF